jgi:hypothetical protein
LTKLADCLLLEAKLKREFGKREELDEFFLGAHIVELNPAALGGTLEVEQRHR